MKKSSAKLFRCFQKIKFEIVIYSIQKASLPHSYSLRTSLKNAVFYIFLLTVKASLKCRSYMAYDLLNKVKNIEGIPNHGPYPFMDRIVSEHDTGGCRSGPLRSLHFYTALYKLTEMPRPNKLGHS